MALAALVVACDTGNDQATSKLFAAPPWQSNESLAYNLVDQGNNVYGKCVLETKLDIQPGRTQLNRLCGDDGPHRDDGSVTVDSKTLLPIESMRVIADSKAGKRTSFSASYGDNAVKLKADDNGKIRDTSRDLPKPDDRSPDPGYYDDEALLWLARGVPLRKDFEGAYHDINAGNAQVVTVDVKVESQERVKVPAGEFTAWRVRIRTSSVTQYVWVDVEAPNRVVRARIERLTYELTAVN
jgi:hypothetical protein